MHSEPSERSPDCWTYIQNLLNGRLSAKLTFRIFWTVAWVLNLHSEHSERSPECSDKLSENGECCKTTCTVKKILWKLAWLLGRPFTSWESLSENWATIHKAVNVRLRAGQPFTKLWTFARMLGSHSQDCEPSPECWVRYLQEWEMLNVFVSTNKILGKLAWVLGRPVPSWESLPECSDRPSQGWEWLPECWAASPKVGNLCLSARTGRPKVGNVRLSARAVRPKIEKR